MDQEKAFEMWDKALWDVYEYDGLALADLLNDWTETSIFSASRYGERVYAVIDDYPIEIFSRWDLWRQDVSYYTTGFAEALAEDAPPTTTRIDAARDTLAFAVAASRGILDAIEQLEIADIVNKPAMANDYLFM